jgi:hypothetical protein
MMGSTSPTPVSEGALELPNHTRHKWPCLSIPSHLSIQRASVQISYGPGGKFLPTSRTQTPERPSLWRPPLPIYTCVVRRRYRHSLQVLARAIQDWNAHHAAGRPMSFVVQLGDALDGKAATLQQSVSAAEVRRWVGPDTIRRYW